MTYALPIDSHVPQLLEALKQRGALVLVAEPGAGKTTRVPAAMLRDGRWAQSGDILVLQPRRIACRLAAHRVAGELGEAVGDRVGYQVRLEERLGPNTRLRFITEGIFTRRLRDDPLLDGVAAVVLDEFHERSLHADFALACLRRLRAGARPELAVVVMSATLEAQPVADFLDCSVSAVPGRTFPVRVEYQPAERGLPLERQVARAVSGLATQPGDILVFLPGLAEIRRAEEACAGICKRSGRTLAVLHGDLPSASQDRAVGASSVGRVILSTNIAETSVTLPAVTAVVDSGLARLASHNPFSGLPSLAIGAISQASAIQRAGRAGRTGPGRCVRLYSESDFRSRPAHDLPELQRADLAELCMNMAAVGGAWPPEAWLSAPPVQALGSAHALLSDLGALQPIEAEGSRFALSPLGKRMAAWPLHPRLARLVLEAERRSLGRAGVRVAALLSERDISLQARGRAEPGQQTLGPSDVLARLELLERWQASGFDAGVARSEEIDRGTGRRVWQTAQRLAGLLKRVGRSVESEADEAELGLSVLTGFPDRVAKRRRSGSPEVVFARGGAATIAPTSVVQEAAFLVAVDAAQAKGRSGGVSVRLAVAIEPEWLLELFPGQVRDVEETLFDAERGRVTALHRLYFEGMIIDESRREADDEQAAAALFSAAKERGLAQVFDLDSVHAFMDRWLYAASRKALPVPPVHAIESLAEQACTGARSFEDLARCNLNDFWPLLLSAEQLVALERAAPEQIRLPSGRRLTVHYAADRPPYVASRMQDFYGMASGPMLAGEPLVLHLLAPNQRPVQVTSDLAGFWQRHYPALRKALARRYPKHPFPEEPSTAEPPAPRPPRRPR